MRRDQARITVFHVPHTDQIIVRLTLCHSGLVLYERNATTTERSMVRAEAWAIATAAKLEVVE
jgi:hypothetical protein